MIQVSKIKLGCLEKLKNSIDLIDSTCEILKKKNLLIQPTHSNLHWRHEKGKGLCRFQGKEAHSQVLYRLWPKKNILIDIQVHVYLYLYTFAFIISNPVTLCSHERQAKSKSLWKLFYPRMRWRLRSALLNESLCVTQRSCWGVWLIKTKLTSDQKKDSPHYESALTKCGRAPGSGAWISWRSSLQWFLEINSEMSTKDGKYKYLISLIVAAGEVSYPGLETPGQAAGSWTGLCNTPAVPLWSSRGHHQNSPPRSAAPVFLRSKTEKIQPTQHINLIND